MKDQSLLYSGQDNAMTEIALALAMGFFSLMVLTLVSMGNGQSAKEADTDFASIIVADKQQSSRSQIKAQSKDIFIIHYGQAFYDRHRRQVDPGGVAIEEGARLVLVVSPNLPLSEIMAARAKLQKGNVVVTEMDEAWLNTLQPREGRQ
jgi:hypothetical protein